MYADNKDVQDYNALIDFVESARRWFERQLAKLGRRLRKADEKGRIAEVEDIRVRMKAFRVAVRALKGADIHDGK